MQNPFQQAGSNPMDGLNDPLAFVKKLWGDMQLPGMVTPTISVDELDKQIKDLKTVESWLNVNMTMLRGTIHALEVQRSTIAALKTMGESFAQTAAAHAPKASSANTKQAVHDTPKNTNWPMPEHAPPTPPATATVNPEVEEKPAQEKPTNQAQTAFDNPAAWWTVLQDQFKTALSTALKEEAKPSPSPSKDKKPASASKPSASAKKPAAKTGTAKTPSKVSTSATKKPSARTKL